MSEAVWFQYGAIFFAGAAILSWYQDCWSNPRWRYRRSRKRLAKSLREVDYWAARVGSERFRRGRDR